MNPRDVVQLLPADELRAVTRRVVVAEGRQLRALVPDREAYRSLLLAFVTGYLGSLCDHADRNPPADPSEITAVLRGVLDGLDDRRVR